MYDEKIISYHTFMLPFTFKEKDITLLQQNWEQIQYKIGYNQEAYFHDFFKNSLFNDTSYYEHKIKNTKLILKVSKKYELIFENATLRVFGTNIAILTLNLKNTQHYDIKSILEINDNIRRLYPEYLDYDEQKSGLVPEFIALDSITENFVFDKTKQLPTISKIIDIFIPTSKITPAIDDRMFVICFYQNKQFSNQLQNNFIYNDDWYKYVFVNGSHKTVQDDIMQKELIVNATYTRWHKKGTLYGITKYSFVCISKNNFPLQHIQTIYFNIFSLLLMIRATLLNFSKEISNIAKHLEVQDTSKYVTKLYENYIKFVNRYYFREVTAKDQGTEIYEKAMTILKIQRDIKDLDAEIEELHNYIDMKQQKETASTMNTFTYIGGALLPPSIVTGFYGMNGTLPFQEYSVYIAICSFFIIPLYLLIKGKR